MIDEIEIRWNGSGLVQKIKNVAANQFVKIKEGRNLEKLDARKLTFSNKEHQHITMCTPVPAAPVPTAVAKASF
jgi:hypothetical protein